MKKSIIIFAILLLASCENKNSREYATDERNYTYEIRQDSCKCCCKQYIHEVVDSILTEIFD
jgi:hypothetical protein